MKQIDFLPIKYRERSVRRQAHAWRLAVLFLFGGVIVASVGMQAAWRGSIRRQLVLIEPQHEIAISRIADFSQLQAEYSRLQDQANLMVYLEHPWPRTQILRAIAQSLPASLVLAKIRFAQEIPESDGRVIARAEPPIAEPGDSLPALQRDLQSLRSAHDRKQTVIRIWGFSDDPVAVHDCVTRLARHAMFAKCELRSLESPIDARTFGESRFQLLLLVKPGYGQAHGPQGSSSVSTASRLVTENPRLP